MTVLTSEFSEFAFGFSVTHKLVNCRIGMMSPWPVRARRWRRFLCDPWRDHAFVKHVLKSKSRLSLNQVRAAISATGSPFIPTQSLEKRFPVDLAMNANGIFYFLQFKRSTCVSVNRAGITEENKIKAGHLNTPLYRVYFGGGKVGKRGKNGDQEQRDNLEILENNLAPVDGAIVRYVAPAFHKLSELSKFQNNGCWMRIDDRWPVMSFKASAFTIPDNKKHWISFDGKSTTGWCYSREPEKVSDVVPLVSEIEKRAPYAPILSQSITTLRKLLDNLAIDMGLEQRSKELSSREFLSIFGITTPIEEKSKSSEAMEFMAYPPMVDIQESELAEVFQKIIAFDDDDDKKTKSRMSFLNDFFCADYRCRQILGQPLMIGVRPNQEDLA